MAIWDLIVIGLAAGCSSFFSEVAKDLKKYLADRLQKLHKRVAA